MKAIVIFFIIIVVAITALSVFDQFLIKGNLPAGLRLQENNSQEKPLETNTPLTASISQPIKPKNNPSPVPEETPEEVTTTSPYYGKVRISRVQAKTSYHPSLIALNIRPYKGERINLTGWNVKTRQGRIAIPKAVEKYQSYFPLKDIIIQEYSTVYLIGSSNPLGANKNFRANKCFGYLSRSRNFYPSIYNYCPRQKLEDISHLRPLCQEFILRSYGCEMPDYSKNIEISTDRECVSYILDYFTYSACFKRSSNDNDFLKNYWYVYINRNMVEPLHDTIYLYDQNGLLVDKRIY